jgi:hypothetical protein
VKPTEKRPLGRPSWTWKNNINKDLKEVSYEYVHFVQMTPDRNKLGAVVNTIILGSFKSEGCLVLIS